MEFRKIYERQQKKHKCIEQSLDSVGEDQGGMIWENDIETCTISYMNELPVQVQCMILDAWGWCTEMTQKDGMGREEGSSGWGTHVYLWQIHVDVWQNQYNIVK